MVDGTLRDWRWLAPQLVEAILGGWADERVMLERTGAGGVEKQRMIMARRPSKSPL